MSDSSTVSTKKQFLVLWLAGMLGVLSTLQLNVPIPQGTPLPLPLQYIKLLGLIQPTILLAVAVFVGITLAPKVGLSAPFTAAIARGDRLSTAIKPQVLPGLVGGLLGAIALSTISSLWSPFLPWDFLAKAKEQPTPLLVRLLYGGITEELLLRWGLMTLLVWLGWRLLQRRKGQPRTRYVVGAIVLSSLFFGMAHLPILFALGSQVTLSLISYILVANSLFGAIAGYLYWRRGLESAMIAHVFAHVGMITISVLVK